jgi:hypothetical protein
MILQTLPAKIKLIVLFALGYPCPVMKSKWRGKLADVTETIIQVFAVWDVSLICDKFFHP